MGSTVIRARIDEELKDDATVVLQALGLTVSDVMRMTLTRIAVDRALPFELSRPNAQTVAAMKEARDLKKARSHRFSNSPDFLNDLEEDEG